MTDASKLEGAELDAAVATLEGWSVCTPGTPAFDPMTMWEHRADGLYEVLGHLDFSRDWALGGPIIEREQLELRLKPDDTWNCMGAWGGFADGPTPLIAAMRAFCASRSGEIGDKDAKAK